MEVCNRALERRFRKEITYDFVFAQYGRPLGLARVAGMALPSLLLSLDVGAEGGKRDREDDAAEERAAARQRLERVLQEETAAADAAGVQERALAAAEVMRAQILAYADLPEELQRSVFAELAALDCRDIGRLCQQDTALAALCQRDWLRNGDGDPRGKSFWEMLCERRQWGPPRFPDDPRPWRREFIRRCTWDLERTRMPVYGAEPSYTEVALKNGWCAVHDGYGV